MTRALSIDALGNVGKSGGASQANGLGSAEAPEPHSGLGPTGAIPSADKPHTARKAGKCVSWSAAQAGNAPECRRTIEVGDTYFDGDMDPYKAGGFGKERVCTECRRKGYA